MAKLDISPTRSELLQLKHRIKLAQKGHGLLKKKQDYLINEFFTLVKEYKKFKQSIYGETKDVYNALSLEIAYTGLSTVRSASYAAKESLKVDFVKRNMMGVQLPQINTEVVEGEEVIFENSPQLSEVTNKFRELFNKLLKLSSMKLAVFSLADEIKKIKRRVNSLEHIQIPKLEETRDYILFVLGEQERENFTRLKMIKQRL